MSPWDEVLEFWLAPGGERRWFRKDQAFDREIRERFAPLMAEAAAGRLDHWGGTAQGTLALLLLLDQFPRNVYRGTAAAFATDPLACRHALAGIDRGFDRQVQPAGRPFFYLPLEHAEDLALQERAVALCEAHGDPGTLDFAKRHHAIIARFGRFPHRNAVLGRASTPEEEAFLRTPGSSF